MDNVTYPIQQLDLTPLLIGACVLLLVAVCVLAFFLIGKSDELGSLKKSFNKMLQSFNELDEQAKLIVATDLELNKAQEELDRRQQGLNTLQRLARTVSMTMDEGEIFRKFDKTVLAELGFASGLVLSLSDSQPLGVRTGVNFETERARRIVTALPNDASLWETLKSGTSLSSATSPVKTKARIIDLFGMEHFVLAPMLSQRNLVGVIFVGNRYNATPVTEGDVELIAILANQLSQSLENSQLFEQVYRSSRLLETKVNERTRELSQALKAVEEVSRKKSEFISAVSHELRTPLTSIKGFASLIVAGKVGNLSDPVRERIEKINIHADHLHKLINDLLDIARIESGRVEMKVISQSARPMVDNIADLLSPQLQTKGISLKTNLPPDLPPLEYDPTQVERVFINLISNAIKFTPTGGTITVNAHPNLEKGEVIFEVADTGIGIKKEDLARVFDEFYRVDNEINLTVKGTGLGLSLVRNIVEAHYGRIWATSETGQGTTFHFTLPFIHQNPNQRTAPRPEIKP